MVIILFEKNFLIIIKKPEVIFSSINLRYPWYYESFWTLLSPDRSEVGSLDADTNTDKKIEMESIKDGGRRVINKGEGF